jgi:hypothetical protein
LSESATLQRWRPLWFSYAVSAAGTSVATGILPIIAILELDASAAAVSALAAVSAVVGGITGTWGVRLFDRLPRVRTLQCIELVQFLSLALLVVAATLDRLTFAHLVCVATIQAAGYITYTAGFNLHMKVSLAEADVMAANSRIEATNWSTQSVGPIAGGALVSAVGPFVAVAIDALSFLAGALGLSKARGEGGPRARPAPTAPRRGGGLAYIWRSQILRPLYINAMTLGGGLLMASPLLALLVLRDLHLPAWQYGLTVGIPGLMGLVGALCAPRISSRIGSRRCLLLFGALRGPCLLPLAFTPDDAAALWVVLLSQSLLLFSAGVFNPGFATTRLQACTPEMITRVAAAWSASAKLIQPACIAAGGVLASILGVRYALAAAACLGIVSMFALPWNQLRSTHNVPTGNRDLDGARN